ERAEDHGTFPPSKYEKSHECVTRRADGESCEHREHGATPRWWRKTTPAQKLPCRAIPAYAPELANRNGAVWRLEEREAPAPLSRVFPTENLALSHRSLFLFSPVPPSFFEKVC
ncbi:MAG: hypothetical protein ABSA83_22800, partial [Verrucomicrobiota bacterium]